MKLLPLWLILAGCVPFEVGCASSGHGGLTILGPRTLSLDRSENSITISPTLELRNTTNETLGISHFGGTLARVVITYVLTDSAGHVVPQQRRDFLGSTLAGTRAWVTMLKPGQSITWTPEEAFIYASVRKQEYRLVAHVVLEPPAWVYEVGLSEAEKAEITHATHIFDSDKCLISVR